jgi:hypothetical protein
MYNRSIYSKYIPEVMTVTSGFSRNFDASISCLAVVFKVEVIDGNFQQLIMTVAKVDHSIIYK